MQRPILYLADLRHTRDQKADSMEEKKVAENTSELEEGEVTDDVEEETEQANVSGTSTCSTIPGEVDQVALVAALNPAGDGHNAHPTPSTSDQAKFGTKSPAMLPKLVLTQTQPKQRRRNINKLPLSSDQPGSPAPLTPAPVTPAPLTSAPVTPAPQTPAPQTLAPQTPAPPVRSSTSARVTFDWARTMVDMDTARISDLSGFNLRMCAALKDMLYFGDDLAAVGRRYALAEDDIREHATAVTPHITARIVGSHNDRVRWARGMIQFGGLGEAEAAGRLNVAVSSLLGQRAAGYSGGGVGVEATERRPGYNRLKGLKSEQPAQDPVDRVKTTSQQRDAMDAAVSDVVHRGYSIERAAWTFKVRERHLKEAVRREQYSMATRKVLARKMTCKAASIRYGIAYSDLAESVRRAREEGVGGDRSRSPPREREENGEEKGYEHLLEELQEKKKELEALSEDEACDGEDARKHRKKKKKKQKKKRRHSSDESEEEDAEIVNEVTADSVSSLVDNIGRKSTPQAEKKTTPESHAAVLQDRVQLDLNQWENQKLPVPNENNILVKCESS